MALLSSFLFKEVIGFWGWLGLSIGVLGISLIGVPDPWIYSVIRGDLTAISFDWWGLFDNGEWLMLFASLSMAIGTVAIPYISRYSDPVVATGWGTHHLVVCHYSVFFLLARIGTMERTRSASLVIFRLCDGFW